MSLKPRERAVLLSLLDTFAPEGYDRGAVFAALEAALARLSPHRFAKLRPLLLLLGLASFDRLGLAARERILRSMADSPIALLRTGFQAFKRLCLFVTYSAVDADGRNPLWAEAGYGGPRSDRIRSLTPLPLAKTSDSILECDVAVVGSGAGSSVAAAVFARAGRRVIVLEMGPPADPSQFTQLELDAFASMYLDSALTASDDLAVSILAGSCVGGGTTVNWCTSLRLEDIVAEQWSAAAGGIDFRDGLREHYDAVSARLGIGTTDLHNANNDVLLRGCRKLGWHAAAAPRNASGCGDGCGYCGFGCCYGSKRSTVETYLRDAVADGAQIFSGARATRAIVDHARVRGVEAVTENGRSLTVRAGTVVLGAGSLRTPELLARSGVASPHLGKHLRLHPTTAIFARFDEPIETWRGPMQTVVSDQFADIDDGYGAKFEAVPAHPGLTGLAAPWRSREQHLALMRQARHAADLIVLTRDRGEGNVSIEGKADISYRLTRYDERHMLEALVGLAKIALAAGAASVSTLHTDPIVLDRASAQEAAIDAFARAVISRGAAANRLGVFSAHQMGTCRMHRDPKLGVVDENGNVHGVGGLIVADASVFPLSSGVNPMLTIMAVAHRTARAQI